MCILFVFRFFVVAAALAKEELEEIASVAKKRKKKQREIEAVVEVVKEERNQGKGSNAGGEKGGEVKEKEKKSVVHCAVVFDGGRLKIFPIFRAATLKSTGPQMRVPQILFHVHVLEQTDGAH